MSPNTLLKTTRINMGITQKELAEKAGVSIAAIRHWEQGDRGMTLENADKVFRALGVSIAIGAAESETK